MKLSILICSTQNRYSNFLLSILDNLFSQAEALPEHLKNEVEIITVIDNKKRMLGTKRNDLLNMAQGQYVAFVDDDDRVSVDYISELLEAANVGADVITFTVDVSLNGGPVKPCYYSNQYSTDHNSPTAYFRLPNHIMCVKRELALATRYRDILKGEDSDYSKRLLPLLETQYQIDRALYYYDYSDATTETQQKIKTIRHA